MPEKAVNSLHLNPLMIRSSPLLHWRFGALTALVFVGMIVVWSVDGCTIKSFLEAWRLRQKGYITMKMSSPPANLTQNHKYLPVNTSNNLAEPPQKPSNTTHLNFPVPEPHPVQNSPGVPQNPAPKPVNTPNNLAEPTQKPNNTTLLNFPVPEPHPVQNSPVVPQNPAPKPRPHIVLRNLSWVSAELEPNLTSNLLARWLAPGGEPCKDSKTAQIAIPSLDGRNSIDLSAGEIHEFGFQALDESGNPRCIGGDYFESDLSGDSWKSRPLVKDFGNGSYSVSLQVHPDFTGKYNLKLILLYRHFEGLKFSPWRFAVDQELRKIPIRFYKASGQLHELKACKESDFSRDIWSGRWTRLGKNDHCQIGNDGRYRCLAPDFPCRSPWCSGSLGLLESNGWVYSAHCTFRLFLADSAWNCLKNRWIFFWGDSNHVDTIRNMLNFVLDLPAIPSVPRRFDMNFSNPKDPTQSVRITSIFNGHWNETGNYEGLNSLQDEGFRNLLKEYFSGDTVPDSIIMNSGLHDGVKWKNIRAFSAGADYAASFWAGVMESVKRRGLAVPKVFYRTTVATGGYARSLAFNPNKMETFNWVLLEKLKQAGVVSGVIDNFDMTFPWHFDNRCNDGVHYGRAPAKMKWRDGHIGHQYFVDLMLVHVLLNALCAR